MKSEQEIKDRIENTELVIYLDECAVIKFLRLSISVKHTI